MRVCQVQLLRAVFKRRSCVVGHKVHALSNEANADCRGFTTTMASSNEEHFMFVYGTLKEGQPNNPFLHNEESGKAEFVARGHTGNKYPLVIAGKYNIPYLLYEAGVGHNIRGDIYKVDTRMRDFMDDFESHPTYYERMEEDIILEENPEKPKGSGNPVDTKTMRCWVYFMKNYVPPMLKLEHWASYDSLGPHGLRYVESEETEDLTEAM